MNTKYDYQVKELILQESRSIVPFLFELQSPYVTLKINQLTLNIKESILIAILLSQAKEYLYRKLKDKSVFELID